VLALNEVVDDGRADHNQQHSEDDPPRHLDDTRRRSSTPHRVSPVR
jgi:hypothetical protein